MRTGTTVSKKRILYAAAYAALFSAAMIFGGQLEKQGSVSYASVRTWGGIAVFFLFAFPAVCGIFYLLRIYGDTHDKRISAKRDAGRAKITAGGGSGEAEAFYRQKEFWVMVTELMLCWLPYFLASYPGYFLYDAQEELNMVLTAQYTTHHPLAHVLLLGWTVKAIHKITGSYNAGIAVYVICQAAFAAMCFSYIFGRMKKWGVRRFIRVVGKLYLCLFPVIPMYVLCTTKDVLFTIFLLLFLVNWIDLAQYHAGSWRALVLNGLLMLLMRKNGVYALVLAIPFMVYSLRRDRKKMILSLGMVLAGYLAGSFGLKYVTNANDQEKQEILSIPIQQMARVYCYQQETLSEAQLETLYRYLPEEALLRYRPTLADPVKVSFHNDAYSVGAGDFWRLWLEVGKENPASYLNAFLVNHYGFWYPYASLNCYKGNQVCTFIYEDSSYFGYETEFPGRRTSLFPALDAFVHKLSLEISWQRIPGIRVLFHPACYFWLFFLGICEHMSMGRYRTAVYGLPVFLLFLTVLLGPAALARYVLYFYFGFPLLLAFLFAGRKDHCFIDDGADQ